MTEVLIAERQRRTERESPQVNQLNATCDRRYFIQAGIAAAASVLGLRAANLFASEESPAETPNEAKEKPLETLSFDEITEKLKPLWRKQHEKLEARQEEINVRCRLLQKKLKSNALAVFLNRWNAVVNQFAMRNGMIVTSMDMYYALLKRIEGILQRSEATLDAEFDHSEGDMAFHSQYDALLTERNNLETLHKKALMTESDGRTVVGLYTEEQNKNHALSHEEYIATLSRLLHTPERLALFLRYFVEYTHDAPNPDKDPLEKGTEKSFGEHWQTPEETLSRTENGKMLGDCEDQAILLREILLKQKKKPFIVLIPANPIWHATCVSIEMNEKGKFDVFDFGTHGLDKNGSRWGVNQSGVTVGVGYGSAPPEFLTGFDTPKEALSAVMKKYEHWMSFNMKQWNANPGFEIARDYRDRGSDESGKKKHTDDHVYVAFEDLPKRYVSEIEVAPLPPSE